MELLGKSKTLKSLLSFQQNEIQEESEHTLSSVEAVELQQSTHGTAQKIFVSIRRMFDGTAAWRKIFLRHFLNGSCLLMAIIAEMSGSYPEINIHRVNKTETATKEERAGILPKQNQTETLQQNLHLYSLQCNHQRKGKAKEEATYMYSLP